MSFDVCRKTDVIEWKFEWKIYDLQKHQVYMTNNQFLTSSILLYCEVEFIPYDIPYTANIIGTSIINTNKKQPNNMHLLNILLQDD
ncbi:hypothetical protein Mgra_00003753 [Meloidogyne graminicola]|uniref:Uncharacterized protein n=1 Tax=Meloidogyne graminicola TaxID=189291 RepID=A0A8S9ZUD6_9BILA|nr:hypothetical protein Mgra_00003753 [Meloidogyne graminicola]